MLSEILVVANAKRMVITRSLSVNSVRRTDVTRGFDRLLWRQRQETKGLRGLVNIRKRRYDS